MQAKQACVQAAVESSPPHPAGSPHRPHTNADNSKLEAIGLKLGLRVCKFMSLLPTEGSSHMTKHRHNGLPGGQILHGHGVTVHVRYGNRGTLCCLRTANRDRGGEIGA